ncbi:MAG: DNA-directed RNA polymerases II 24 kDa polypeptide (RNA polymerase II subunit 5) [Vezdaea aestivalis]|nr:MAG: DNA-directed RNA polymerases II 24 kDa polypeptide (RNA polymerase II subunit 5) [Vezdaea aestivalis]
MDFDDESGSGVSDKVVSRLWRAWRTVNQMVKDRGYELSDEEVNISLAAFKQQFSDGHGGVERSKLRFSANPSDALIQKHTEEPTASNPDPKPPSHIGTLWVEFNSRDAFGVKEMKAFAHHINEHNYTTGIIVTANTITSIALKIIPTLLPSVIETFLEQELLVNISHHELVPTHLVLSKAEKQALLMRYRLRETQLPRIQQDDPMARYLGLKRGQVVKIIRKSETAGRYASYRWVI